MDLRRLRYFVAVAEERHVGRAAARLRMTQPPLSRTMRQLEADLGATLLDRTSSGVELTEAGQVQVWSRKCRSTPCYSVLVPGSAWPPSPIQTVFMLQNSLMPGADSSRPYPEARTPPNGSSG